MEGAGIVNLGGTKQNPSKLQALGERTHPVQTRRPAVERAFVVLGELRAEAGRGPKRGAKASEVGLPDPQT
jgi:hypothetical protein